MSGSLGCQWSEIEASDVRNGVLHEIQYGYPYFVSHGLAVGHPCAHGSMEPTASSAWAVVTVAAQETQVQGSIRGMQKAVQCYDMNYYGVRSDHDKL